MEDNKENSQENATEKNEDQESTIENNTSEENKTNSNETKIKLPKIKLNFSGMKKIYEGQYKKLLIIPFMLLLIAILLIGLKAAATGDFINRDVSLKGGVTVTIPTEQKIDILQLEDIISKKFPKNDVSTKSLSQFGTQVGVIIDVDVGEEHREEQIGILIEEIGKVLNRKLTTKDYSVEVVGSSLGASFFREVVTALLIAFLLMAIVVFLYFRTLVPSGAVILAALSDILITLSIVNLLDIKLSTAGIAAFLMLIGYSVDTNILLSTRVLKRKEGTEMERIYGALKTGITMSLTTLIAMTATLIFTQSEIIKQIMIILLIGLLVDLINTWIQNVGILRLYLERKARKTIQ
ncbi:preprotein translocase subunit SecF [Candidatus Woesearchaeota archaeon]|nr:preprotein translocase subunit SecF [Candidatus Woesearchaeota archaeon]|tara:strand:- start:4304 stop:5356 length:1053 start_codon:yes stop_codon:yes gene_type:complete